MTILQAPRSYVGHWLEQQMLKPSLLSQAAAAAPGVMGVEQYGSAGAERLALEWK